MVKVTLESLYAIQKAQGDRLNRLESSMEGLKNRLPVWATMAFGACTALITGLFMKVVG